MKQLAPFDELRSKLRTLKATAETLTVTDSSQTREMKLARETRLSFREVRIAVEHRRRELVEAALREKQRIDSDAKTIKDLCDVQEERLLEMEEFAEREAVRIEDELRTTRQAAITPFLSAPVAVDLGKMKEGDWAQMLSSFREAHEARIAAAVKAKADQLAKERHEAEERERIRLENERLKKEAAQLEESARKEREAAAAALKKEREEAARKAAEQKARADAEAKRLREKAAQRERIAAEKARREREAIESAAAKENARLAEIAEKQRQESAELHAALKRKIEAEQKVALDRKRLEEAAELAPEKEKLKALAKTIRKLHVPVLRTEKGIAAVVEIAAKVEAFAGWVNNKAEAL